MRKKKTQLNQRGQKRCVIECKGVYADIAYITETQEKLEDLLPKYESYKKGFEKEIIYPENLNGEF